MWRFLLLCWLPLAGLADEHWIQFQSGPFEVFTNAGAKSGRETLVRFEQFRNALGQTVGDPDLKSNLPIRILLFKTVRETTPAPVVRGRDRYAAVLAAGAPVPPAVFRECTRLLLEANTARMPDSLERGLMALFSTLEVKGITTTLGRPVPAAERTKDWARVHLLATDPEYYGKLRVLIYNLRRGVDEAAAYRNALGKSPADIDRQTDRYLAAGNFQTVEVSSRPMSVEHDFPEKPVDSAAARLALADLLLDSSRAAYESMIRDNVDVAEAWEGLGLLALRGGQTDAARADFSKAMAAGTHNASVSIEYARLEPDQAKARTALEQALKLDPKLAEAHFLIAQREPDLAKRVSHLQAAANLNPRNAGYWQALAEAYLDEKDFPEAAKAWRQAEQASTDDAQRARMRQARLRIEQQRLDYEAAERKRQEEEKQREIDRLKAQARADLRALESKYNQGSKPDDKAVPWWDGPKPQGKAGGLLKQVDCLGKQARLVIEGDDKKITRLLIPNPSQIAIMGGGEHTLGCGPQKPRRVLVEYFPKVNSRLATSGEVATIEFR